MRARVGTALVVATAAAAAAVAIVSADEPSRPSQPSQPSEPSEPADPSTPRPAVARETCSTRSEADFPGAFTSPANLVAGPLVLIGGAYTDPATVREFGGNKFPVLVKAGHRVTVRLPRRARRIAGLAYGPLPQGEIRMRDTYRSVTFVACGPGRAPKRYRPDGPSGSEADGVAVTFWSGFVLTRVPACIRLHVHVDEDASPQRVGLGLGRRCRPGRADLAVPG